jgi:hypothetical protein
MGRWAQRVRGHGSSPYTGPFTLVVYTENVGNGGLLRFDHDVTAVDVPDAHILLDGETVLTCSQVGADSVYLESETTPDPETPWEITGQPVCVVPTPGSPPIGYPQAGTFPPAPP